MCRCKGGPISSADLAVRHRLPFPPLDKSSKVLHEGHPRSGGGYMATWMTPVNYWERGRYAIRTLLQNT